MTTSYDPMVHTRVVVPSVGHIMSFGHRKERHSTARIWELDTGKLVFEKLPSYSSENSRFPRIESLVASRDGRWVVTAGRGLNGGESGSVASLSPSVDTPLASELAIYGTYIEPRHW